MITMSKRFKKSMAMAMATAMAFSIQAMPVYQAEKVEAATVKEAEATSALNVEVSEEGECAGVTLKDGAEADVIYYAVTTKDKDGKIKYPKASAYEAVKTEKIKIEKEGSVEKDGNVLDLSWVNRKKDQILCVATGSSVEEIKPVTVDLKAQDTVIVTYSGSITDADAKKLGKVGTNIVGDKDFGYLTFNTGTKKEPKVVSASAIQFRTINGDWSNVVGEWEEDGEIKQVYSTDFKPLAIKGATLQMRVAPNDDTNTPAGKIVNVKIKAKSKAPNVTVNYNDKMVSVPAKVEYSLDNGKNWKDASTDGEKTTVALGDYEWDGSKEKTVYFRTEGTDKKASSKIKYVTIKTEQKDFAKLEAPVSGAAVIAELPTVGSGKLDVRYKTAYKNDSGLVFTNTTDDMYQVAFAKKADIKDYTTKDGTTLVAASSAAIVAKSAKKVTWATVSAQDTKKSKAGSGKLSLKKGEKLEDYVLLYRIADKKGTVNSEVRIFDVPGTVKQSVKLYDGSAEATKIEIAKTASGNAVTSKELTVSGSGITATNAKYTVAVYTDKACTTKYTNLAAKYESGKLKVATNSKTEAKKTYYVKVNVEGAETVLEVVVAE